MLCHYGSSCSCTLSFPWWSCAFSVIVMCCLNGCQGPRAWVCVCSDPSTHPDSIHRPACGVWEKGGGQRGETKWKRERETLLLWLQRQQSLSYSIMGVQGPPMSSKQRPEAPLFLTHRRAHAHTRRLPSGETREQESDSGELSVLGEGWRSKSINKQCNCVHVCHSTLACVHPHRHAQWKRTDCGWYHYSKHRWQEGQIDNSLIEHIYMAGLAVCFCVCVCESERQANCDQSFR